MVHRIDTDYSQAFLLPPALEDWIEPTHPARFIREFVEALELEEMDIVWASGEKGRPAYSAQLLLKLWLYGYFERIRSSRKREKACRDHIGFVWLAGMHRPDHNTLNNFFRSNKKGIRNLFKKTVRVAVEADMVGFVLHAVDGTKIAARVANRGGWNKKKLLALLEKLDSKITELEKQLEEASACDTPDDALPKELGERQALRKKVRSALHRLEEKNKEHLHPSDEDACVMPCKEQNRNAFAYNGKAVADETCCIPVACEATCDCNDEQQLNAMLDKVQEQAGQNAKRTVADTGYATGCELARRSNRTRRCRFITPTHAPPKALRHKSLYGNLREHLGDVLRALAERKECRVKEGHLMPDHVHMMIAIPPKYAVSQVVGYIKGKSAIHIARVYGGRKRNFVGQHFWARGFFVSTLDLEPG